MGCIVPELASGNPYEKTGVSLGESSMNGEFFMAIAMFDYWSVTYNDGIWLHHRWLGLGTSSPNEGRNSLTHLNWIFYGCVSFLLPITYVLKGLLRNLFISVANYNTSVSPVIDSSHIYSCLFYYHHVIPIFATNFDVHLRSNLQFLFGCGTQSCWFPIIVIPCMELVQN